MLRLVIIVAATITMLWIVDQQIVFSGRRSFIIRHFDEGNPYIRFNRLDSLLMYRDIAGGFRYQPARQHITFLVTPPRSFRELDLALSLRSRSLELLALRALRPNGEQQTTLFWNEYLEDHQWNRLSDGSQSLYQRKTTKQFESVSEFKSALPALKNVGSLFIDEHIGRALTVNDLEDLHEYDYLVTPTPQFNRGVDHGTVRASYRLKDLLMIDDDFQFTVVASRFTAESLLEFTELSGVFRGDAITPLRVLQRLKGWFNR